METENRFMVAIGGGRQQKRFKRVKDTNFVVVVVVVVVFLFFYLFIFLFVVDFVIH